MSVLTTTMVPAAVAEQTFASIAASVNALNTTWVAEEPARFGNLDEVRMLCGTFLPGDKNYFEANLPEKHEQEVPSEDIPSDFDVRTAWPKCAAVSGHIRDQSACGSCWAFGSTEAFNDRHCIATGETTLLSVEDTAANCGVLQCGSMGCNGGHPGAAWNWFVRNGVVTGGDNSDIGKGDTCAPYSFPPCAHHVPATEEIPACPKKEYPTPVIGAKCTEKGYSTGYHADKRKAGRAYAVRGISKIQSDMMTHGSVTASIMVYDDFPTYKSGVYHRTSSKLLGGHAVKVLGWGVEDGQDYWLVANSWNNHWGAGGLIKMRRGHNECGIETGINAGTVSADDSILV